MKPRLTLRILALLWLLAIALDGGWLWLDRSVASWDPADHLIGSLNYWWTLHQARWTASDWWDGLWTLSSKYPPLLYISTAPVIALLGRGSDQAVLVNIFFTALLLATVYGLGRHLFNARIGLWGAGLCLLLPQFYTQRTQYFMDYPLVALVTLSFLCLTLWRSAKSGWTQGGWAIAFGLSFGLALLMKQSALFFLAVPLAWVGVGTIRQRQWGKLLQLVVAGMLAIALLAPWLSHNWLFQITAGINANVRSAVAEGDPPLTSLAAWTFYLADLPRALSFPLLVVPVVGILLATLGIRGFGDRVQVGDRPYARYGSQSRSLRDSLTWLAVFLGGAYLIWSAVVNKDNRYVMPYLPVLALVLAYGMTRWQGRWRVVPWGTVAIAVLVMLLNLFPLGGAAGAALASALAPQSQHHPELGVAYPHPAVVDAILATKPYQISNLGLLHSNAVVNQHNFTYYGNQRDFQVYARRVGNRDRHLEQDVQTLSWFLYETGSTPGESRDTRRQRVTMLDLLQQGDQFERYQTWEMPDGKRLLLLRRRQPFITVQPLGNGTNSPKLALKQVTVSGQISPGTSIPIRYEWTGSWRQLHDGLVLLTWHLQAQDKATAPHWIHDHAIGLGTLHPGPIQANQPVYGPSNVNPEQGFRVVEQTAMIVPKDIPAGTYVLEAEYLNPVTGETVPLPDVAIAVSVGEGSEPKGDEVNGEVAPQPQPPAPQLAAAPVDFVSQLRQLATQLPEGVTALAAVFDQVERLNLYDPVQYYLVQAEQSLTHRLQQEPENLDYAYALALTQVLQQDVRGAIAALEAVTRLDAENPNAHAYLAFVNLYAFHPWAAEQSLAVARELAPESKEIQGLSAIAALMRGNLWAAWQFGPFHSS
jgi:4-amino-4-deoxy-L-arabinose transferase-like glycosyltransferase